MGTLHHITQAAMQPTDHQAIALDVIGAYAALSVVTQAELERAFAGDMNIADIHRLATRMLRETPPEAMALVLARLVVMADEAREEEPPCTVLHTATVAPLWNPSRKGAEEMALRRSRAVSAYLNPGKEG